MRTKNNLEVLISEEAIIQKIEEIAKQIDQDYEGNEIVIVMVMKGAVCLVADLIRHLNSACSIESITAKSYGARGIHRGELTLEGLSPLNIRGKHVLVVDDIYDSGTTLTKIIKALEEKEPATLRALVLLSKNIERHFAYEPDYILFEIDNLFVVGYGLDYKESYRGLPSICVMTDT